MLLPFCLPAATNDLASTLQKGLFEEEANHNLEAAAQAYQAVSVQFDKDRKLAATAIFRLGEVYRKQGKTNEATAQYERIVREFSDQETLATLSRQNLAALNNFKTTSAALSADSSDANSSETTRLAGLLAGIDEVGNDPEKQARAIMAFFPDENLKDMLLWLPKIQEQEAKLRTNPAVNLERFYFAITTDGSRRSQGNGLAGAQEQLQKQLSAIGERVSLILGIQRARLKVLQGASGVTLRTAASIEEQSTGAATDEEEKEIRRIQVMIQNSPDLINAGQKPPLFSAVEAGYLRVVKFLLDQGADVNARSAGATPLHTAAKQGQKAMAELLLSRGAMVNAQNTFGNDTIRGRTPLHEAAEEGFQAVAEVLLANKADVAARDAKGNTPLHLAASRSRANLVALLAPRMPDINAENDNGTTALGIAAARGSLESVRALLAAKADANAGKLDQPLLAAISFRRGAQLIELLLSRGADANAEGSGTWPGYELGVGSPYISKPLALASERGDPDTLKTLLQFKAYPNVVDAVGRTPLSRAGVNTNVVKLLLDAKADPNLGTADSPLVQAVRAEDLSLVEMLLRAGANPNQETDCALYNPMPTPGVPVLPGGFVAPGSGGKMNLVATGQRGKRTPLQAAVLEDRAPMVKLLLQFKGDPKASSSDGRPLVLNALGNPEMLNAFLDAGTDPNAKHDTRPLIVAAAEQSPAAVQALISHGAKVNVRGPAQNQSELTPLHVAAIKNEPKSVELLLNAKADANAASPNGWTALHHAAVLGSKEMVEMLLSHGADVNAKADTGDTPLHWAVPIGERGIGAKKMVELLLSKGADPNIRGFNGWTPLDRAKGAGYAPNSRPPPEIVTILRAHGALDDLPDFNSIRVTRVGVAQPFTVFTKDTNSVNRFTLLEVIRNFCPVTLGPGLSPNLPFPDFSKIIIHRPSAGKPGAQKDITVNLLTVTNSFDCAKDTWLEFGDLVELPEREHTLAEPPVGLTRDQNQQLSQCLEGKVILFVRGQKAEFKFDGTLRTGWLQSALDGVRHLLRSSSDLSRIKVKRTDPATRQTSEFVTDSKVPPPNNLWLRDGDVIEVPDKP